jgi:hypothetical protein
MWSGKWKAYWTVRRLNTWSRGELVGTNGKLGTLSRVGKQVQQKISGCGFKTQEVTENEVRGQAFSPWVFQCCPGKECRAKRGGIFIIILVH